MSESLSCTGTEFFDLGSELLGSGAVIHLRVSGSSMYPLVRDGDVVEISPCEPGELRIGDVVLVRTGGRLLVHRVVALTDEAEGSWLHTRGDFLCNLDPLTRDIDLLGRVGSIHRGTHILRIDRGILGVVGWLVTRSPWAHRSLLRLSKRRRAWTLSWPKTSVRRTTHP